MSDERSNVERNTKSEMANSTMDQSQNQNVAIGAPHEQTLPPILKLNIDCFEELFEWLSLTDLRSLRQACKRLNQVVDFFIKTNYPAVRFGRRTFKANLENLQKFQQLDPIEVKMIKRVDVDNDMLTKTEIAILKAILPQIEELDFVSDNKIEANFYETILQWCTNLKRLYIFISGDALNGGIAWLEQRYPSIEHFILSDYCGMFYPCSALRTFFALNPNIQTFSCTTNGLEEASECFLGSNIKIHRISLEGNCSFDNVGDIFRAIDILKQLYEQGVYKQIDFYITDASQYEGNILEEMPSVRGLDKLSIDWYSEFQLALLPLMPDLREFSTLTSEDTGDWESVAKNLANIERINFTWSILPHIVSLIRYAVKLKEIKVGNLFESRVKSSILSNGECFYLSAWNEERKKLAGACKVTIYVSEALFLSRKFAKLKTDYNLIALKRAQAIE